MNHLEHSIELGSASRFALAREAILGWMLQESAGVVVRPARQAGVGQLIDLRLNPAWPLPPRRMRGRDLTIPVGKCEVTEVIDAEKRAGFVYRTLPGHLESGEQRFEVFIAANGRLAVSITSHSAPGHPLLKAFAPLSVAAQRMMAKRYAEGLRRASFNMVAISRSR